MAARSWLVAVFSAAGLFIACRQAPPPPPPPLSPRVVGPPRVLSLSELTPAERLFGHSASEGPGVTYQPDVVIPPGGAEAIRSVSENGLVWTIDPDAAGASRIETGKVLLLTSRAAGRVLAVQKTDKGLEVVLGPADITEFVRDGTFSMDQPVDLESAAKFDRPAIFDQPIPSTPVIGALIDRDRFFLRPVAYAAREVTKHQFSVTPLVGTKGIGVRIVSEAGGVMFLGQAVLYVQSPRLHFNLDIRGGSVKTAEVQLTGIGGLLMEFEAAMPKPTDANINESRFAASDFGFPIGGFVVPLAVHARQQFLLKTAFTSTGTLKARGHYKLQGSMRAGYRNGSWELGGPTGFSAQETLLPSIQGVAVGVTGMVLTHQLNVIAGVGAAGFVAGPYAFLNSSVTAARGSSIGFDAGHGVLGHGTVCRQESVSMGVGAGVGYQIPRPVTSAINAVLRALHIREEIKGSGGFETKPQVLVSQGWYSPKDATWCGGG